MEKKTRYKRQLRWVTISYKEVREEFSDEITFEQWSEGREEESLKGIYGENIPGKRNTMFKDKLFMYVQRDAFWRLKMHIIIYPVSTKNKAKKHSYNVNRGCTWSIKKY